MKGESAAGDVTEQRSSDTEGLAGAVAEWLGSAADGDYVAIQAYVAPTNATTHLLQRLRLGIRDRFELATTLGYGPRFLHSTGQFHKGGPNIGLFLQLTHEAAADIDVPETDYSFGKLIAAESLGDYQALQTRDRRVLRVNLGTDVAAGLAALEEAFDA